MTPQSLRKSEFTGAGRYDKAGLFLLLAMAFIPSLLTEFDAARLFLAIEEAAGRITHRWPPGPASPPRAPPSRA